MCSLGLEKIAMIFTLLLEHHLFWGRHMVFSQNEGRETLSRLLNGFKTNVNKNNKNLSQFCQYSLPSSSELWNEYRNFKCLKFFHLKKIFLQKKLGQNHMYIHKSGGLTVQKCPLYKA
jgi:hypothetical protein